MIKHDIKCPKCGKVLAAVELADGEKYPGDLHFGFYCPECAPVQTTISDIEARLKAIEEKINK